MDFSSSVKHILLGKLCRKGMERAEMHILRLVEGYRIMDYKHIEVIRE
jgi:hypothetical protein